MEDGEQNSPLPRQDDPPRGVKGFPREPPNDLGKFPFRFALVLAELESQLPCLATNFSSLILSILMAASRRSAKWYKSQKLSASRISIRSPSSNLLHLARSVAISWGA